MDEGPEYELKRLCCTCLSDSRELFKLCRVKNGVNNLYWLLSGDSEAYREGFYKDTASLHICWECNAILKRISKFRHQACDAQRQLTSLVDGQIDIKKIVNSLSRLNYCHKTNYDLTATFKEIPKDTNLPVPDNFIDCGVTVDTVQSEDESDIPLSELNNYCNFNSDDEVEKSKNKIDSPNEIVKETIETYKKKKKTKIKKKVSLEDTKYYVTKCMSEVDMLESRVQRKLAAVFVDAEFKCESCIECFISHTELEEHNMGAHSGKANHSECDVCHSRVTPTCLQKHREEHYLRHSCQFCDFVAYTRGDILRHLKAGHAMKNLAISRSQKGHRKTPRVMRPGSKPRRNQPMRDKRTPYGYLCVECNKYFESKDKRYKHTQRHHREWFKCTTCGKVFPFRNQLTRHAIMHVAPPPREECAVCHKLVRRDLVKCHARIHTRREAHRCLACDKLFVSRASYENHLKYTQAHAAGDILKFKCTSCDKGYRSRAELRDHVNYQHMGKTQHKCPICDKALATRRCITRHVRRAHHGVKESARDKVCQLCGKAFRDKKGLREHEFTHTGERPLSCEICGGTFRQSASLYTHKKRVHKLFAPKKSVELLTLAENTAST